MVYAHKGLTAPAPGPQKVRALRSSATSRRHSGTTTSGTFREEGTNLVQHALPDYVERRVDILRMLGKVCLHPACLIKMVFSKTA